MADYCQVSCLSAKSTVFEVIHQVIKHFVVTFQKTHNISIYETLISIVISSSQLASHPQRRTQ